jgi:hypothetical protein
MLQGRGAVSDEREKQQPHKWPFDPMQPGDHEPVRLPDDHPAKQHPAPAKKE